MKISKTLLILIFLMIGSCYAAFRHQREEELYLSHVVDVLSGYDYEDQPLGYRKVFATKYPKPTYPTAPFPYGLNTDCENFYLNYKEYLSNLANKNEDGIIELKGQ